MAFLHASKGPKPQQAPKGTFGAATGVLRATPIAHIQPGIGSYKIPGRGY